MVDLGVYNFVKNAVAAGKSREDINADLTRRRLSSDKIEEALAAVHSGARPAAESAPPVPVIDIGIVSRAPALPVRRTRGIALVSWLVLFFALVVGIAVYLGPRLSDLQAAFQGIREHYQASRLQIPGGPSQPTNTQ